MGRPLLGSVDLKSQELIHRVRTFLKTVDKARAEMVPEEHWFFAPAKKNYKTAVDSIEKARTDASKIEGLVQHGVFKQASRILARAREDFKVALDMYRSAVTSEKIHRLNVVTEVQES